MNMLSLLLTELQVDAGQVCQQRELHELELEWALDTLVLVVDADVDSREEQRGLKF